jgi:histone deacetylase 6
MLWQGEMELSPSCYAHMTSSLMGLGGGKVGLLLEGGYCIESLAEGAALSLRALLGDPCPSLALGPRFSPHPALTATLSNLSHVLSDYWKCIEGMGAPPLGPPPPLPPPAGPPFPTRASYPVQSPDLRHSLLDKLSSIQASTLLLSPPHKVSFVYDPIMMLHTNYQES